MYILPSPNALVVLHWVFYYFELVKHGRVLCSFCVLCLVVYKVLLPTFWLANCRSGSKDEAIVLIVHAMRTRRVLGRRSPLPQHQPQNPPKKKEKHSLDNFPCTFFSLLVECFTKYCVVREAIRHFRGLKNFKGGTQVLYNAGKYGDPLSLYLRALCREGNKYYGQFKISIFRIKRLLPTPLKEQISLVLL